LDDKARTRLGASKFNVIELDGFRIKPFSAAARASNFSAAPIWDAQATAPATGTGQNCQEIQLPSQ
jgi:hypothetical protein